MSNKPKTETVAPDATPGGIPLSDGRLAVVVPALGRHIRQARRMQTEAGHDFLFAMIAQLTTLDGKPIVVEELDDMPARDVARLQGLVEGN